MKIRSTPPLKPVNHDLKSHAWCGPTVLSAITGAKTSDIRTIIQRRRWSAAPVKGVTEYDLRWVLYRHRFCLGEEVRFDEVARPTLAAWLRGRTADERKQTFVLMVRLGMRSGYFGPREKLHWVVVRANTFVDTYTKGQLVTIGKAPHRRKRVVSAFPVWKEEERPATTSPAPLRKAVVGRRAASVESRV